MGLTKEQRERYARHLALKEIGPEGQERLSGGSVLLVGVGGLGSIAGYYLAAAGVGKIGLVDSDLLQLSNLQRQIAFATVDLGQPKVELARRTYKALNPEIEILTYHTRLTKENAPRLISEYKFIIDATDNFASKEMVAETCHKLGKPYSHAGILQFYGQLITVIPGHSACYSCLFHEAPADEDLPAPAGPLGVVPAVIGSLQAAEAIKFLLGIGKLLTNRLLTYDALKSEFREIAVKKSAGCPLCGTSGKKAR